MAMNTTFIILMVLSCFVAVGAFMTFTSAMHCRRYKDNGAYKLAMSKYFRITAVLLALLIVLSGITVWAATNCQECGKIAMHEYCTHCGAHVEANDKRCDNCGAEVYGDTYCGHCGAKQEESK